MKSLSLLSITLAVILSGCSVLPHSGPSYSSIKKIDKENANLNDIYSKIKIIDLNTSSDSIKLNNSNAYNPVKKLINEKNKNSKYIDSIGKGDSLKISIMETPPAILFVGGGDGNTPKTGLTELPIVIVDSKGFVSLPFVGDLKVLNKTPSEVQNEIIEKLSGIANRPQVIVSILEKRSSNATVIGDGFSGKIQITAKGERLLDAVTMLGNSMYNVKDTLIRIVRNNKNYEFPLSLVLSNPEYNVQLQQEDVITLINKPSAFISMGATGATKEVPFEAIGINLSQALARIGGLRDNQADTRGIFVFRYQENLSANNMNELIPVVYQIDLSKPNSLFIMKNFEIKNNDIVYVASAPIIELQKFLYAIFSPGVGVVNQINQVSN